LSVAVRRFDTAPETLTSERFLPYHNKHKKPTYQRTQAKKIINGKNKYAINSQ